MKNLKKYCILFTIGGVGYAICELLWRRRTHWSMVIAGGLCFIIFSFIADKFKDRSLLYKAMLCALSVTSVELIFGIVFNMILGMGVWDYSDVPFNFLGQICPFFTLLWGAFGLVFIPIADALNNRLNAD